MEYIDINKFVDCKCLHPQSEDANDCTENVKALYDLAKKLQE